MLQEHRTTIAASTGNYEKIISRWSGKSYTDVGISSSSNIQRIRRKRIACNRATIYPISVLFDLEERSFSSLLAVARIEIRLE